MVVTEQNSEFGSIVVAGCGYTGLKLVKALNGQANRIISISRTTVIDVPGVESVNIDLDSAPSTRLDIGKDSRVCYLIPPATEGDPESRFRVFVEQVLTEVPRRVLLISTTGVYGDCQGEWVDEKRPINPQTDRAKRRVKVEQFCHHWAEKNGVSLAIFRVAGIYGPDRVPVERLRRGIVLPKNRPVGFSNRIHVEDLVNACVAGLIGNEMGVFNVSDGHPMRYSEYFNLVAEIWNLPGVVERADSEVDESLSSTMRSYLNESRKIDNQKLLDAFQLELRHPHPRLGLMDSRQTDIAD